jgi:hypothetical protein
MKHDVPADALPVRIAQLTIGTCSAAPLGNAGDEHSTGFVQQLQAEIRIRNAPPAKACRFPASRGLVVAIAIQPAMKSQERLCHVRAVLLRTY